MWKSRGDLKGSNCCEENKMRGGERGWGWEATGKLLEGLLTLSDTVFTVFRSSGQLVTRTPIFLFFLK